MVETASSGERYTAEERSEQDPDRLRLRHILPSDAFQPFRCVFAGHACAVQKVRDHGPEVSEIYQGIAVGAFFHGRGRLALAARTVASLRMGSGPPAGGVYALRGIPYLSQQRVGNCCRTRCQGGQTRPSVVGCDPRARDRSAPNSHGFRRRARRRLHQGPAIARPLRMSTGICRIESSRQRRGICSR